MSEVTLNPSTLVELLRRGIHAGIPPTALGNMFDVDPEVVQNLSINMRRERYGTAELSEALSFLTWTAYEETLHIIRNGAPELRLRATQALMGKALATSVRQTPEEVSMAREAMLAVVAQYRLIELEGEEIEPERSTFVAVDDSTDDQG